MPSSGTRQRFPEKSPKQAKKKTASKEKLSEEEAVTKASRKWVGHFLIALVLSLVTPIVVLVLLPSPVKPKEYPAVSPPPPFEGPLALNNHLAFAEKLYEDKVVGPESLVIDGDKIYTGTMDGWVNVLHKGKVQKLVRFGNEPCGSLENENTCGRPLGLRMDKDGFLVVCDAYLGLFKVDVKTGQYETLYKTSTPAGGKASKFLNDLDVDKEGRIYFSDSSTEWYRNQFFNVLMEGETTGRLLMYDPKTKKTEQLIGGLMFPNGVQLTPDQSGVLVAEFGRARIMRYDVKSKDFSVWADGLPGNPDNIRYDEKSQTYWVGMGTVRFADKFSVMDYLAARPWLRGIIAKLIDVSNLPKLKALLKYMRPPPPQAMAVEYNKDGNIVSSLQDSQADIVQSASEVHVSNGMVFIGSYHANFIARLDKKKVP